MAEELGKVEKPSAEGFQGKRKLFFVPLLYCGQEAEKEYVEKFNKYWSQVESQISELEQKLGLVKRIFHELIPIGGEDGAKVIKELNEKSYLIVVSRLGTGAQLEATEESDALTEFMDWSKCLMIGLQNQKVFTKIYEFYTEAGKKRNEYIARQIAETLKPEESGILFMREGHQVQFPSDIEVFYVAPPALDEIKRWFRDREAKPQKEDSAPSA